jgi:hypothetical protein
MKKIKPRGKQGTLFIQVLRDETYIRMDTFKPIYDGTDHMEFECMLCGGLVDVIQVEMRQYRRVGAFDLYFYLSCPICGASGQRKIYLDRNPEKYEYDQEKARSVGMERMKKK